MFPTCRVSFNGLKADSRYAVLMDIVPVDNKRYRYAYHRSCWLVAGKADPPAPPRLYVHPDSPFTGEQLRKQVVSFEKVKLTNNDMDRHGHVSIKFSFAINLFLFNFFFFFSLRSNCTDWCTKKNFVISAKFLKDVKKEIRNVPKRSILVLHR